MAWTRHGHWYGPGEPGDDTPVKARCGGPGLCNPCSTEAVQSLSKEMIVRREQVAELVWIVRFLMPLWDDWKHLNPEYGRRFEEKVDRYCREFENLRKIDG